MHRFGRAARAFDSASGSDDDSDSSSDVYAKSRRMASAQFKLETTESAQTHLALDIPVRAEQESQPSARAPTNSRWAASAPAASELTPSAPELQSGLTIQDLWDNAETNFKNLTGASLRAKNDGGMLHIMSRLDNKYGTGTTDKGAKTKKVVTNIVEVIKNLGGIAAQGASMVFGPADICFNAVSFLLDIPAKIDKLFSSVGDLFERLNDYLMKLEIYKRIEKDTKIPQSLLYFTNVVLAHFVDVCALAYGLAFGSKAAKTKAALLVVFANDDSGLSAALRDFDSLIARQGSLELSENLAATLNVAKNTQQIPVMASNVTEIRSGVDMLVSAQTNRSVDRYFHEQREIIAQKLGIEKSAVREQEELMKSIRCGLRNSGSELLRNRTYQKWASFTSDVRPAIFLGGEQRFGRSYLIDAILNDMESKGATENDTNTANTIVVGYYIFQKKDERSLRMSEQHNADNKRPIETALKHICLQIANRTKAYTREVSTLLQTVDVSNRTAAELWGDLNIGRPRSDTMYLLVFEGLDQVSESQADALLRIIESLHRIRNERSSAFTARSRIRILVSGAPKSLPASFVLEIPQLSVVTLNTINLRTLIDQDLESEDFKESVGGDNLLKAWIQETLPEASNGDFSKAQRALENLKIAIKDGDDIEQAKQALLDACDEDPSLVASNIIQDLSKSLSIQDIKRLNILLMWTIFGHGEFSLDELKALSYLSTGDNPYLPFHQIVKTKYSKVFDITQAGYVVVKSVIEDYFRRQEVKRNPQASYSSPTEARITMEIKIQNASVSQVKRFLWSLNEQVNFDASVFQTTGSQIEEKAIEVYEADSTLSVAMKCLELLNDKVDDTTGPLVNYAVVTINDHLRYLWYLYQVKNLISVEEVKQVQSALIAFLSDVEILEEHRLPGSFMREYWLDDSPDLPHIIAVWLTAPEGVQLLDRRDRRTLNTLMDEHEGAWSFYKPITLLMVKRWLQSDAHPVREVWDWIDGYIEKTEAYKAARAYSSGRQSPAQGSTLSSTTSGDEVIRSPINRELHGGYQYGPAAGIFKGEGQGRHDHNLDQPRTLTQADKVERAIRWAKQNLVKYEENAVWYRKIAETFQHVEEYQEAIIAIEEAKRHDPDDWMLYGDAAQSYAFASNWKEAISQMSRGLEMAKMQDIMTPKMEKHVITGSFCLIDWLIKDESFDEAIKQSKTALSIDPFDPSLQFRMLDSLRMVGKSIKTLRNFITETLSEQYKDQKYSKLVNLVQLIISDYLEQRGKSQYEILITAAQEAEVIPELLDAIRRAGEIVGQLVGENEKKHFPLSSRICLLLESGVLALREEPGDLARAIDAATKALTIEEEDEDGSKWWSRSKDKDAIRILRQIEDMIASSLHRLITSSIQAGNTKIDKELDELRYLVTTLRGQVESNLDYGGLSFYISSAVVAGRKEMARDLISPLLERACEMLSNDTPDDDLDAYFTLAQIFACLQDEYNCRVAWSLYAPFDAHIGLEPEHVESYSVGHGYNVRPHGQGLEPIDEGDEGDEEAESVIASAVQGALAPKNGLPNNGNSASNVPEISQIDQSQGTESRNHQSNAAEAQASSPVRNRRTMDDSAASTMIAHPTTNPTKSLEGTAQDLSNGHKTVDAGNEVSDSGNETPVVNEHLDIGDEIHTDVETQSAVSDYIPTYTRTRREHISPTTANFFRLPWVFDPKNEDYIIIKEEIHDGLREEMFSHTRMLVRSHAWFSLDCNGNCNTSWMYASDVYMCRFCQEMVLCGDCRAQVQKGSLKHLCICHPKHEWIYIPHWSNEYFRQVGRGNVRVGGTIGQGGYIEGGEIVNWRVWLNGVRKEWGLPEIERWKSEEKLSTDQGKKLAFDTDPFAFNYDQ